MSAVRKTQAAAQSQTPERAALAAAIKAKSAHDAEVANAKAAHRKVGDQLQEAELKIFRAREVLAAAQEANAAHLVATATGETESMPAPISLKAARADLLDAEDNVVVLRRAQANLAEKVAEMQGQNPAWKPHEHKVRVAAQAVLRSEVNAIALFSAIRELQAELVEKRLVLCFLQSESALPEEGNPNEDWVLPSTRADNMNYLPQEWRMNPAPEWHGAFSELCEDAKAPLPELPLAQIR